MAYFYMNGIVINEEHEAFATTEAVIDSFGLPIDIYDIEFHCVEAFGRVFVIAEFPASLRGNNLRRAVNKARGAYSSFYNGSASGAIRRALPEIMGREAAERTRKRKELEDCVKHFKSLSEKEKKFRARVMNRALNPRFGKEFSSEERDLLMSLTGLIVYKAGIIAMRKNGGGTPSTRDILDEAESLTRHLAELIGIEEVA